MSTFAQRFTQALQMRNMTAAELSRKLGINEGTISNYKKGTYEPKQRRLEAIAKILNVSIPWLMGADVPMNRNNKNNELEDESEIDRDLIILNRNAKKMTPENRKKLIEMAKLMFGEDFDD